MRALHPVQRLWEEFICGWALRELRPTHRAVPAIVRYLADRKHAPSPLDPADSVVTGICILASLALLALGVAGWLPGGGQ